MNDRGQTTELQRAQWEAQRHTDSLADCPICIYILIFLLAISVCAALIEIFVAMRWLK